MQCNWRRSFPTLFLRPVVAGLIGSLFLTWPGQGLAAATKKERDECAQNLEAIYEAVQSYRREHQELPDWLSDLVPDHLDSPNTLICPVTRRTGEIRNSGLSDPKVSTSYVYEFCNHPIPTSIRADTELTMREWKQLQMALAGSIVPLIRCHHHQPVLSLSFGGAIFESPESWESEISGIVRPEHLMPGYLSRRFGGGVWNRYVPVDLDPYYNCQLTENPHSASGTDPGPNLAMLPDGEQDFGGVVFKVGGIIHLQGRELKKMAPERYPDRVENIPVGLKTTRLHFLVGAGWPSADNIEVARFIVHYEDGASEVIPIHYNQEIRDWLHGAVNGPNAPKPAWSGDINPSPNEEQVIHLHRVSWNNPRPNVSIQSLDLESTLQDTAPFILAISAQKN